MMTRKHEEGTGGASHGSPSDRRSAGAGELLSDPNAQAIFDAAPHGMLIVDREGRIRRINPQLEAIFGYTPDELAGQPSEVLFPDRYRERHAAMRPVYHARPLGRVFGFGDLTGRRKNGEEFPLEISLCPIVTPHGRHVCATFIDVTERERGTLRLREMQTLLGEIAQAVSRDVHDQVHEVATLVAYRAESPEAPLPLEVERTLRRLSRSLADVEHMLDDLTVYSEARHFPVTSETIDLGAVIDEAIAREAPGAGVSIDVSVPRETFTGARAALAGVLRSLLSNAITHHDRETIRIEIQARLEDDQCLIDFTDDGPGIPQAAQQHVFQLFQTLSGDRGKRSGMGLAMAQRMVEAHGASLALTSHDGTRGTHFRISWPRYLRSDRAA